MVRDNSLKIFFFFAKSSRALHLIQTVPQRAEIEYNITPYIHNKINI